LQTTHKTGNLVTGVMFVYCTWVWGGIWRVP